MENLDTARTISVRDVSTARKIVKNYPINNCKIKVFYYHVNDVNVASRVNDKCPDYSLPYQKRNQRLKKNNEIKMSEDFKILLSH